MRKIIATIMSILDTGIGLRELLGFLVFLLVAGTTLMALFTLINLIFPGMVQKTIQRLEKNLLRSALLGLANTLLFGAIVLLCVWLAQRLVRVAAAGLIFIGGVIVLVYVSLLLVGLASCVKLLGERLGGAKSPLSSLLRGALLLILACLTPFVGWYLVTPLVFITAFGASLLSLFKSRSAPLPAADTEDALSEASV